MSLHISVFQDILTECRQQISSNVKHLFDNCLRFQMHSSKIQRTTIHLSLHAGKQTKEEFHFFFPVLSWKSEHPKDSHDYLDEEYVDLDSKDEYMSDEPVNTDEKRINLSSTSKQKSQLEKKKKKMTNNFQKKKKSKPEEGSGGKVADDDDDDEDDDEDVLEDDEGSGNYGESL